MQVTPYSVRRAAQSSFVTVRGLRYHALQWGRPDPQRTPLVLLHGWMDVAASFQFVVDALERERHVVAVDWRGFGLTETPPADSYWFADYLGDLDALLDAEALGLGAGRPIDLLGHSMGGNVAMLYAGVRPQRLRRLVNLEGFGMPDNAASAAPKRLAQWLDELKTPQRLNTYASVDAVAQRLMKNNPLLPADKAAWLAPHWSRETSPGVWELLADPAHKRVHAVLARKDEALACWQKIAVPVLWVDGDRTDLAGWWGTRYTREEFETRLAVVPQLRRERLAPAGHMLHHDQPEALAALLEDFLGTP